jgi:hypothetical protein
MYATVRQYEDIDPDTYDELHRRRAEIERLLKAVPSFRSYFMLRTRDGLTTVTICGQHAGAEESNRRVAQWIREELATFMPNPPAIAEGEVIMQFAADVPAPSGAH